MKTNVQVKDEPVELQNYTNEILRLYGYNLTGQSRTKSVGNQEQEPSTCAWCQKLGIRSFTLRTDNGDSKELCSEVCFNQYRRASFKKNKGPESDFSVIDHNSLSFLPTKTHQLDRNLTIKTKSPSSSVLEKKIKTTNKRDQNSHHQVFDTNRRKILLPIRRPIPTKINGITQKLSPSPSLKRHRSSSSSSSSTEKTLRVDQSSLISTNLTWPSPFLLPPTIPWPPPVDINRFQYPLFPPLPLPPITSSSPSTLFTTLAKGTLTNFTCILPTFIPLPIPIPIPLCFPIHLPCVKCTHEVNHQECQTEPDDQLRPKRTRRMSF